MGSCRSPRGPYRPTRDSQIQRCNPPEPMDTKRPALFAGASLEPPRWPSGNRRRRRPSPPGRAGHGGRRGGGPEGRAVAGLIRDRLLRARGRRSPDDQPLRGGGAPPDAARDRGGGAETRPALLDQPGPRGPAGRTFLLVFDDIHLSPLQAQRAKVAVGQFLKTGVREGDRVTLIATGGGAWWNARMPEGRETLIAILKRLDGPLRARHLARPGHGLRGHAHHGLRRPGRGLPGPARFDAYGAAGRERVADREYADSTRTHGRGRASSTPTCARAPRRSTTPATARRAGSPCAP